MLIPLLLLLIVGAIVIWLIPDPSVKALGVKVLTVMVIVMLLVWVLQVFGLLPHGVPSLK